MFYTYIIRSKKDGKLYTGSTKDLRKRFKEHNNDKVFSTKDRGPFDLIYYEACINETDARVREWYLKTGMGKRYIKNRLKRFLSLTGFTLIEIMVAVAILSFGIVAIYESFITSTNAYNYCLNHLSIRSWTNEKLWEVQDELVRTWALNVDIHPSGSFVIENKKFEWDMSINLVDTGEDLYKVDLTISWREGNKQVRISRITYITPYSTIRKHKE